MKNKKWKKILAAFIAVMMVLSFAPLVAFAEEGDMQEEETPQYILWYASNYTDGLKEILDFEGYHDPSEPITVLDPDSVGIGSDREGYKFLSWNTRRDGSGKTYLPGSTIMIDEETTLYAQWEHVTYSITLTADSASLSYNGQEQEVSGFSGVPDGLRVEGITASASGLDAGEYEMAFSGTPSVFDRQGNDVTKYAAISTVPGVFTIEPLPVMVEAHHYVKTEGQTDPEFNATVDGLVGSDEIGYALFRDKGEAPGIYDITVEVDDHDNYEAQAVHGTLEIKAVSAPAVTPEPSTPPADLEASMPPAEDNPQVDEELMEPSIGEEVPIVPAEAGISAAFVGEAGRKAKAFTADRNSNVPYETGGAQEEEETEFTAQKIGAAEDGAVVIYDMQIALADGERMHTDFNLQWGWLLLILAAVVVTGLIIKRHVDQTKA